MNTIATHCFRCQLPLTDPLSIECGMGPDCRKNTSSEVRQADADFGKALAALGSKCPVEVYEEVATAYGTRKGFGDVDTTLRDVAKACRAITRRISAMGGTDSPEQIARYVLAIEALGYHTLARAIVTSIAKRRTLHDALLGDRFHVVDAEEIGAVSMGANPMFAMRSSYNRELINQLYKLPYGSKSFDKQTKVWTLKTDGKTLFGFVMGAKNVLLASGPKGVKRGMAFEPEAAPKREWWVDQWDESRDGGCWVDEHGACVRFCLPGEPASHPAGYEKVPHDFFLHGSKAV